RPELRDDAVVRVEARRREPAQRGQVDKDTREERTGLAREQVVRLRVVEAVALALPEREVDVTAVARAAGPRLGRERGDEAELRGDAADRLSHEDLLVDRAQRGGVSGGDLLLPVAELRVVLLERDVLPVERLGERVDESL